MKARNVSRWSPVVALLSAAAVLFQPQAQAACMAGPPLVGVVEQTPSDDFVTLANGTALHTRTRLIWKRCAEGQTWDGSSCTGAAQLFSWGSALTRSASATDAGSTAWRVPNRKELESIIEFCGHSPALNQQVFPNTPPGRFWTSTTFQSEPSRAWEVYFSDGYAGASYKSESHHVRLVRSLVAGDFPLPQTVTFASVAAVSLFGSVNVSASATSGLPVILALATPAVCSLSDTTVTINSTGTCTITGNQAGNAEFAAAPEVRLDLNVGKMDQTISFGALPVMVVGGAGSVVASASSGLPVTLVNATPAICTLSSNNALSGVAAGVCLITANQSGNASYNPALQVTQSITVTAMGGSVDTQPPPVELPVVVLSLVKGWNLAGNGTDTPIAVDTVFADSSKIESVWKWTLKGSTPGIKYPTWAFRTPTLSDKGAAWAASRGYELLSNIQPGEGFWVSARVEHTVPLQGAAIPATAFAPLGTVQPGALALAAGWSLIGAGQDQRPAEFHAAIGGKSSGLVSLWAWDAAQSKWLFYAPSLAEHGSKAHADYVEKRGMVDFFGSNRRLAPASGLWVHRRP